MSQTVVLNCGHIYRYHCKWITPPHDKIALCIQSNPPWVFWISTKARFHGVAQLLIYPSDHPNSITHSSYLDLSSIKVMTPQEVVSASHEGKISTAFRNKIVAQLAIPNKMLTPANLAVALANL